MTERSGERRNDGRRIYGDWLVPEWIDLHPDWTEMVLHDTWVDENGAVKDTLLALDPDEQTSRDIDTEWMA